MRLALLSHAPVLGGSTDLFIQARDFFQGRGHEVQCFFGQPATTRDPRTLDGWILPGGGGWRERMGRYAAKVRDFQPDLVYAISGRDETDLLRFLPFVRVRHLSSLEQHEYFDVPHTLRQNRAFAEAYTANTPDTLETVARITGQPTFLLPYLFPEPLNQIREVDSTRLLDPANPIEIAYVSRLEQFQKRTQWLPEIVRLCAKAGAHLQWHIYGDGPNAASLRESFAGQPNVVFHGWVDRATLYEKLPRHDILFFCSRWEGLPIAIVEGMRCGLAVLSTDIPAGIRWTLQQGGGWLYDATKPADAVTALLNATRDRGEVLVKRREALQLAGKLFTSKLAERQFLELEASLQQLRYNGQFLEISRASKFRGITLPTYLKRLVIKPRLTL